MAKKTQAAALIRSRIVGHGDVNPEDLLAHPQNFRRHPGHQMDALRGSMKELGWLKTILVNKTTGHVLDGHARVEEAMRQGLKTIPATIVELSPEEERLALAVLDPITEMATRDQDILDQLLAEVETQDAGLRALLDELGKKEPTPTSGLRDGVDPDAVPEPPKVPVTKPGDIITLGRHRLMCGDSTKAEDVARLMDGAKADMVFTDPPYGINIVGKNGKVGADNLAKNGVYAPVIGDDTTETAMAAYRLCVAMEVPILILWGGNYYALPPSPGWIVWDKRDGMASNNFADCELAWTNLDRATRLLSHRWSGMVKASEHGQKRVHPTQKPVALAEWTFQEFGKPGDKVLDLFGGSGSTLIACEATGRTCYMMEMAPDYCDVIIQRWEEATGGKAERVSECGHHKED